MAYTPGTSMITAPVSIYDVQRCFGSGRNDLGDLIANVNINRWAKYKPVKYKPNVGIKIDIMTAQNWIEANYGIKDIPTWTRLSYASTFLFSDARGSLSNTYWPECDRAKSSLSLEYWAYNRPSGGESGPYRLHDFDNYFHTAEEPIGPMDQNSIKIEPAGTLRVIFKHGAISNYTLKLGDLTWPDSANFPIGNMYFGVLMKQTSGTITSRTYVATQKNGDGNITMSQTDNFGFWVDFSANIVEAAFAGTWKIFPIISSIPIAETTSISTQDGNKFLAPLPFHNQPITISIQYAEILITNVVGYKDSTSQGRYARFILSLKNEEPSGAYRTYTAQVTLCDSQGNTLNGWSGGSSGQQTMSTGTTTSITISPYIAQIYSADIYFRVELTINNDFKFKRSSYWALTGPIPEQGPTPDA